MTVEYASPTTPKPSKAMIWTGRVISALIVIWMAGFGLLIYFTQPQMMTDGMAKYGYSAGAGKAIFIVELICVALYAIPQTAVLGAILLTGYLGGAVSTHVRAGEAFWFPIVFGILVWLGLYLRDARVRALVPLRRPRD